MLICHKKSFIFTKTVKTAGTSVESYYEPFCMPEGLWEESHYRDEYISETGIIGYRGENHIGKTYYNHMPAAKIKELVGDKIWNDYFKFTIVRNPFSKLVSGWYHFYKPNTKIKHRIEYALKRPENLPLIALGKKDIFDFRNWLQNGGCIIDRNIYMINGKECMDFYIRYESIIDDIKVVNTKLGIESYERILPKFKTGIRDNKIEIRDFYNRRTEKIVRKIYRWEFDRFGYEMP